MSDKTKAEADPAALVSVLMLMSVRDTDDWGGPVEFAPAYGAGRVVEMPRAKAVAWCLRGFCDPQGWTLSAAEIAEQGRAAFEALEQDRRASGRTPEGALSVPMFRRRYERLLALLGEA